jgi:hypothetical protein
MNYFKYLIIICLLFSCSSNSKSNNKDKKSIHKTFDGYIIDTITYRNYDSIGNLLYLQIKGKDDSLIDNQYITDLQETQELEINYVNTINEWESYLNPKLEKLDIFMSKSNIDTSLYIERDMNRLKSLRLSKINFNLEIIDTLFNLKYLVVSESNNSSIYSKIDANLFPKLETLIVNCKYCPIELPTKYIKRLDIKTNLIDTSYDYIEKKGQEQRK